MKLLLIFIFTLGYCNLQAEPAIFKLLKPQQVQLQLRTGNCKGAVKYEGDEISVNIMRTDSKAYWAYLDFILPFNVDFTKVESVQFTISAKQPEPTLFKFMLVDKGNEIRYDRKGIRYSGGTTVINYRPASFTPYPPGKQNPEPLDMKNIKIMRFGFSCAGNAPAVDSFEIKEIKVTGAGAEAAIRRSGPPISFPGNLNVFVQSKPVSFKFNASEKRLYVINRLGEQKEIKPNASGDCRADLPCGFYRIFAGNSQLAYFAVVPEKYPNNTDSALGVDYAMASAGFSGGEKVLLEKYRKMAKLAALAGVKRVRERLLLASSAKSNASGKFYIENGPTDLTLKSLMEEGISVCGVFQSLPEKFALDHNTKKVAVNTKTAYAIAVAAGNKWGRYLDAWEIYNEVDLRAFYEGSATDFASFFKAFSLGLRRTDPSSLVTLPSFARSSENLRQAFRDNDLLSYYQVFNFHTYAGADAISGYAKKLIPSAGRPAWCTEAGLHIDNKYHLDKAGDYSPAISRKIVNSIGPIYAELLAAGVQKAYFFLWRFYPGIGSIIDRDMQITERYSAIAATNFFLGNAIYKGSIIRNGTRCHLFDNGFGGKSVLAWSPKDGGVMELAVNGNYVVYAPTGEKRKSGTGYVRLLLQDAPVFITADKFSDKFTVISAEVNIAKSPPPAKLVAAIKLDQPIPYNVSLAAYEFAPGQSVDGVLSVTNLSSKPYRGKITCRSKWRVVMKTAECTIAPGATSSLKFILTAPSDKNGGKQLGDITFSAPGVSTASTRAALASKYLTPKSVKPVFADLNKPLWTSGNEFSGIIDAKVVNSHFTVDFKRPGIRMLWPSLTPFAKTMKKFDFSEFDGIRVRLKVNTARPGTWFMCALTEKNGARYGSERIMVEENGDAELLFLFPYFTYIYANSAPDGPDFHLNLEDIQNISIGFHTLKKYNNYNENYRIDYEITGVDLVKF